MNILLVDDHAALRRELIALFDEHEDLHVIGEAADGETGVRMARELGPDVIVMDVAMPGMNGIEATLAMRDCDTAVRILVLSNHDERNLVKAMFTAGPNGYVRKDRACDELIPAIRAVTGGKPYVSVSKAWLTAYDRSSDLHDHEDIGT